MGLSGSFAPGVSGSSGSSGSGDSDSGSVGATGALVGDAVVSRGESGAVRVLMAKTTAKITTIVTTANTHGTGFNGGFPLDLRGALPHEPMSPAELGADVAVKPAAALLPEPWVKRGGGVECTPTVVRCGAEVGALAST